MRIKIGRGEMRSMSRAFRGFVVVTAFLTNLGWMQARAQTDVALSGYAAFNQSTSSSSVIQHPASQGGYLVELRHINNPIMGFKVNYGFNRANQNYQYKQNCALVTSCTTTAGISADAHEATAEWVVSLKLLMIRPFAFAGGGVILTVPKGGTLASTLCAGTVCSTSTAVAQTRTDTTGIFTYGAGADWTVLPHLGLRFQYRGRVNQAPDLVTAFFSTGAFTRTVEPVFGAFLSF
jgi:opacity protein-like surface antigen